MGSLETLVLREAEGGVLLGLKVIPRSSRDLIAGVEEGLLKVKLHSPPVEGAANEALLDFLSMVLDLPKRDIRLVRGERSRRKVLHLRGMSVPAVLGELKNHAKEENHA